jgi:hypothetical protein
VVTKGAYFHLLSQLTKGSGEEWINFKKYKMEAIKLNILYVSGSM